MTEVLGLIQEERVCMLMELQSQGNTYPQQLGECVQGRTLTVQNLMGAEQSTHVE